MKRDFILNQFKQQVKNIILQGGYEGRGCLQGYSASKNVFFDIFKEEIIAKNEAVMSLPSLDPRPC